MRSFFKKDEQAEVDARRGWTVKKHGGFSLEGKLVVVGFPGMALVGKSAADAIARKMLLEKKASIYTVYAPGAVSVERGILKPAEIALYARDGAPVAVLTAHFQPSGEEGQNALAHALLSFLREHGAEVVVAAAAYVSSEPPLARRVFAAASSQQLLEKLIEAGAVEMSGGITGLNGLVPALAPLYGMEGAVLLGETGELYVASGIADFRAAAQVVLVVGKLLGVSFDVSDMIASAENVERWVRETFAAVEAARQEAREEEERGPPTHM